MNPIKIAIVDDSNSSMECAVSAVNQIIEEHNFTICVKQFYNGIQLISDLQDRVFYDIYLLDIELPDMNGFLLADRIRMADASAYVVFITSHDHLGKRTFPYFPYATIFKSEGEEPIRMILGRICKEITESVDQIYTIANEQRFVKFPVSEIVYLVKEGKNVVFHCRGDISYWERKSLKDVYAILPAEQFAYIDKGKIINLMYVESIREYDVTMTEGSIFALSRRMAPLIKVQLMEYYGR